jgi:hypothetical protein
MKVRKRPVVVDAVEWDGKYTNGVFEFAMFFVAEDRGRVCPQCKRGLVEHGRIGTLEGSHIVCPGDWIITGVKGERYPCKPDIFDQTYEKVQE